jgi:hypothetical protein
VSDAHLFCSKIDIPRPQIHVRVTADISAIDEIAIEFMMKDENANVCHAAHVDKVNQRTSHSNLLHNMPHLLQHSCSTVWFTFQMKICTPGVVSKPKAKAGAKF